MATRREEIIIHTGMDNTAVGREIRSLKSSVQGAFREMGTAIVGYFTFTSILAGLERLINKVETIKNTAEETGQTVEGIQKLDYAFEQTGISVSRGNNALVKLNELVGQARTGGEQAQGVFEKWGIAISGRGNAEIIHEIADRMMSMTDSAQQAAMAFDLLGRGGKDLIPLLKEGADHMHRMADHAPLFSEDDMKNVGKISQRHRGHQQPAGSLGGQRHQQGGHVFRQSGPADQQGTVAVRAFRTAAAERTAWHGCAFTFGNCRQQSQSGRCTGSVRSSTRRCWCCARANAHQSG